jgi:streptogramin lyase
MNEHNTSQHFAPQPMCAALEPLLPLLSLDKLEPEETSQVREHIASCRFCQSQLVEFDMVRDALRRYDAPVSAAPEVLLPLQVILDAADSADGEDDDWVERLPLGTRRGILRPVRVAAHHHGRERLSALGALAAVLLLAVLATSIFNSLRSASQGITVPGVGTLVVFPLLEPDSQPRFIVAGRDGKLWFSENGSIGRITPQGAVKEFPLSAGVSINGLAAGPDGNIWFTDGAGKVGRLSPQNGTIKEFPLPTHHVTPGPIVAGPDGNLWFGASDVVDTSSGVPMSLHREIGRITPPNGAIKEFPLPTNTFPTTNLTVGPDGNIWFTDGSSYGSSFGDNEIGRITPQGIVEEFLVLTSNAVPGAIVTGPDRNLWFVASLGSGLSNSSWGEIGRITPARNVTEFPLPNKPEPAAASPSELTAGPDGNVWFVVGDEHTLGRITPQGTITEFALPAGTTLGDITLGPDGNLWFTDTADGTIGHIELHR